MTYKKNFVVVIKHKGKVLRDMNEVVKLPFGADYSILLKNKDSVNAVARVEVDGKDALDGNSIIIPPNDSVELKGFMKGSKVRNHFRFIEKTNRISKYRGDRADDGLVRVEFQFEQRYNTPMWITSSPKKQPVPAYWDDRSVCYTSTPMFGCSNNPSNVTVGASTGRSSTTKCSHSTKPVNDAGITVKGAEVKQDFNYDHTRQLEAESYVITLQLKGITKSGKLVRKPIMTRDRIRCTSCGKKSRSNVKFCGACGTYIQ